jgi:GNAT superfamily N-acetyltransferase
MDRLRLRVATPADAEAVAAILLPSYARLMAEAYPPALLRRTLPLITRANPKLLASGRYYLVEAETGEPAGCGGWSAHRPGGPEPDPRRAHIRHFATHPAWIRRGVGRRLYERCEADARAVGFTRFECWSSLNGESFYTALGFRRVERIDTPLSSGIHFPAIRMERAI